MPVHLPQVRQALRFGRPSLCQAYEIRPRHEPRQPSSRVAGPQAPTRLSSFCSAFSLVSRAALALSPVLQTFRQPRVLTNPPAARAHPRSPAFAALEDELRAELESGSASCLPLLSLPLLAAARGPPGRQLSRTERQLWSVPATQLERLPFLSRSPPRFSTSLRAGGPAPWHQSSHNHHNPAFPTLVFSAPTSSSLSPTLAARCVRRPA